MTTERYLEHSSIDFQGFAIRDAEYETGDSIWVGYGGMEGRWMTADEVREFAALLLKVADAHEQRVGPKHRTEEVKPC